MAVVEPIPNIVWYPSIVVESHGPYVRAGYTYTLHIPAIISPTVQVHIADIIRTWTVYVIGIRGACLKSTRRWIIDPCHIHL